MVDTQVFDALVGEQYSPRDRLVSALLELSTVQGGVDKIALILTELACTVTGLSGAALERIDHADVLTVATTGLLAGSEGLRVPRSGSLSGLAVATARPQVCSDTSKDPRVYRVTCERMGIASMAIVPIRHERHTIAVLLLASSRVGGVTEQHVRLVDPLIRVASTRLSQADAAATAAARLNLMHDLAAASKNVLSAEDPGRALVDSVARIVGAPHVYLMLPVGEGGSLTVSCWTGAAIPAVPVRPDLTSLVGTAYVTGRPQIVADWTRHPKVSADVVELLQAAGIGDARSVAHIPLETPDAPVGVLTVMLREPMTAANADLLGLLKLLAAEAGIAITRDDLRRRLAEQARTDPLTGLANRRVWNERLEFEAARVSRGGAPFAIAFLDLDLFKRYNDSFGHRAGDELLVDVASAWAAVVRPTDLLARLGGEEFGVILPETELDSARATMTRLCAVVPGAQTVSIGLTAYRAGEDPDVAMQRADEALYAAKEAGRNQVATA
jgi:diguanylate cyclase (GGDEF)-like protein